jgi:folate-binding protein YgfZ
MNQWQAFEARNSERLVEREYICDADPLGLILVTGAEARDFLHNQISSDIDLVTETRLQLSSYSTPKGRMVGIFRIIRVSNGYLLLTPRSMVLPLLERLFKFIVRADVRLADASDYFARFALSSENPRITGHSALPAEPGTLLQSDTLIAAQLEPHGQQKRYLLLCLDPAEAMGLWQDFSADLEVAGFDALRLSEIRAGIPTLYPRNAGEFVLQMANLGPLGGVSFKKGCYPGQEIVARMQYLGKLKRRMFLATIETDQLPQPGDDLVQKGRTEADGSGKIVDAAFDSAGLCHCLYIAQIARAEAGELELLSQPGKPIHNAELPYPPPG